MPHANALTLATVDDSGQPSGRVLLLKDLDRQVCICYQLCEPQG